MEIYNKTFQNTKDNIITYTTSNRKNEREWDFSEQN